MSVSGPKLRSKDCHTSDLQIFSRDFTFASATAIYTIHITAVPESLCAVGNSQSAQDHGILRLFTFRPWDLQGLTPDSTLESYPGFPNRLYSECPTKSVETYTIGQPDCLPQPLNLTQFNPHSRSLKNGNTAPIPNNTAQPAHSKSQLLVQ
jgi:hypothetical protein